MPLNIAAGVKDTATDSDKLKGYNVRVVKIDLTQPSTFAGAFKNIDIIFLLLPAQISAVKIF